MAKRRNLKKEKALRNQAYARKFRKRTQVGRFGRRRLGGFEDESEVEAKPTTDDGSSGVDL